MNDFIESAFGEGRGLEGGWLSKTRRTIHIYNVYGSIISKTNEGCSPYYELLDSITKNDGWASTSLKLENEFSEMNVEGQCENEELICVVLEIIKQFMLRLLRYNLLLAKKAQK